MTRFDIQDQFALRNDEVCEIRTQKPASGRWFAVMARTTDFPPGEYHETTLAGQRVEKAAVLAAQIVDDKWQWMTLATDTRNALCRLLFDHGFEKDHWHYCLVSNKAVEKSQCGE